MTVYTYLVCGLLIGVCFAVAFLFAAAKDNHMHLKLGSVIMIIISFTLAWIALFIVLTLVLLYYYIVEIIKLKKNRNVDV